MSQFDIHCSDPATPAAEHATRWGSRARAGGGRGESAGRRLPVISGILRRRSVRRRFLIAHASPPVGGARIAAWLRWKGIDAKRVSPRRPAEMGGRSNALYGAIWRFAVQDRGGARHPLPQLLGANPRFQADPDQLQVGDIVEIPERAASQPAAPTVRPQPTSTDDTTLGKLSEQYETGGGGPGTCRAGSATPGCLVRHLPNDQQERRNGRPVRVDAGLPVAR